MTTPEPEWHQEPEKLVDGVDRRDVRRQFAEMRQMLMTYGFALDTMVLKVNLLREDFHLLRDYNPIEHVNSRVKTPQSILEKARRKGVAFTPEMLKKNLLDIAGLRLTCSFRTDIYQVRDHLLRHEDVQLVEEKDYIENPKPNGYQSLHLIVKVPVHLSKGIQWVPVEIQLRTVAMDFWASLEHKIYYKYRGDVPRHLTDSLKLAADMAATMDTTMERLYEEVRNLTPSEEPGTADPLLPLFNAIEQTALSGEFYAPN